MLDLFTYGSVCSGIEAATVAWSPLGWKPAWFAEIDAAPSAVLKHHYPTVHNHGDFTKITDSAGPIDLLCGGTPCQSFSVAGKRAGLDDPRGHLTLEFLALAGRLRPRWLVWENVPGILSDDGGRTFGTFLGLLGKLGYGFAYRILDAQHFGVPQRRRRVFVVGYFGDWRPAAAVLFERFSLSGNPPPSRETRQGFTYDVAPSLTGSGRGVERGGDSRGQDPVVAMALNAKGGSGRIDAESETFITHSLRADGFDASEGTGRETPLVVADSLRSHPRPGSNSVGALAIGFYGNDSGHDAAEELCPTLRSMEGGGGNHPAVAVNFLGRESGTQAELGDEVATALRCAGGTSSKAHALIGMAVRRLMPGECEKLQGFPPGYTAVPHRGKPMADGPRYKMLGNSWAVPVPRWIGTRIELVRRLSLDKK